MVSGFLPTRLRVKCLPLRKRAIKEASELLGLPQLQGSQIRPDFLGTDLCTPYSSDRELGPEPACRSRNVKRDLTVGRAASETMQEGEASAGLVDHRRRHMARRYVRGPK